MEVGASEKPSKIKVAGPSRERRLAHLDGTVKKVALTGDSFAVSVGNTGLSLRFLKDISGLYYATGDFRPGGYSGNSYEVPVPEKDAIKMFAFGLYSLKNWVRDQEELKPDKVGNFRGITNKKFSQFVVEFFTKNDHADLIDAQALRGGELESININLGKLLDLPEDDPLIKKIDVMGKRADGSVVAAMVPFV